MKLNKRKSDKVTFIIDNLQSWQAETVYKIHKIVHMVHTAVLVVNYSISNTIVLEIP